ncbi:hypothetical protein [Streptomyces sp. NPDC058457]|uniref:hypothetical protein n=1 Tax=Streptomyces sp. NPDC058457 TaxID=3346507 RepID=UPI003660141A
MFGKRLLVSGAIAIPIGTLGARSGGGDGNGDGDGVDNGTEGCRAARPSVTVLCRAKVILVRFRSTVHKVINMAGGS